MSSGAFIDRVRVLIKRIAVGTLFLLALFFLLDLIFPVDTQVPFSTVLQARDSTVLYTWLAKDEQWRMKARLDEISPELKKAIVYKEDKRFYRHFGVDLLAVGRAAFNNVFQLRRTSGASTITMQVARMLDPKPRNLFSKMLEMFCALQLELHYSKEEILQLYLNLVPYGSNIQGVKAAALLYFNKMPNHLSLAEITALSIIPNRPNSLVVGRDNKRIVAQRNKWLQRFKADKVFAAATIDDALREPLEARRHAAPHEVPQFAWRMRRRYAGKPEVLSSLDYKMQQKAEQVVANYMAGLKLQHINNAAVLIVDNEIHEVLTYIGSAEFDDHFNCGQVDGVRALRSPGSALKPLLYALCFDKGLVTPKSVIADIPINIQGYTPENYDRTYRGNVTVDYALSHSLNIPAVKLLDQEGKGNFFSALADAGFASVWKHRRNLGLSIVLGGCTVTLEELTALYATFANEGQSYPLRYAVTDSVKPRGKGLQLLSRDASYMLSRVLCELHRPDLPNGYDQAISLPRIAWKTGTSYGRKDAWSIGYNKRYTVGVWLGNFSGMGVPELSGASTATPLLFQVFNAIDRNAGDEWLAAPEQMAFRLVCAETGKVPNDFCHNQVMDHYIPGVSTNDRCDHLKETWVSADERYSYCTSCLPPNGYKTKLLPNIASDLAAYYDAARIPYGKLPAHNSQCTRLFTDQLPVITSLVNGNTYLVMEKEQQKLQLSCTVAGDVHKVYWYVNDKFFAVAQANQKLFFMPPTASASPVVKISCTDDKGRNANIRIKVRFI